MEDVDNGLKTAMQQFQPDFVIYNAGTDILQGDPLGALNISREGIIERDELVFSHCLKTPTDRVTWDK
jgi:histone deacetylase 11